MVMEDRWLSITEYSRYRDLSVSSVRRYIKSNKVIHRLENGKYLIFVPKENYMLKKKKEDTHIMRLQSSLYELEKKNQALVEEVSDLKMLIAAYEQNISEGTNKLCQSY